MKCSSKHLNVPLVKLGFKCSICKEKTAVFGCELDLEANKYCFSCLGFNVDKICFYGHKLVDKYNNSRKEICLSCDRDTKNGKFCSECNIFYACHECAMPEQISSIGRISYLVEVADFKTLDVKCLEVLSSDEFISGGDDFLVKKWSIENNKCSLRYESHLNTVTGLAEVSLKNFVSCSYDGTVYLWSSESVSLQTFIDLKAPIFSCTAFNENNIFVSTAKSIFKLSILKDQLQIVKKVSKESADNLTSVDGKFIAFSDKRKKVELINSSDLSNNIQFEGTFTEAVSMCGLRSGLAIASGKKITLNNFVTGRLIKTMVMQCEITTMSSFIKDILIVGLINGAICFCLLEECIMLFTWNLVAESRILVLKPLKEKLVVALSNGIKVLGIC